MKIIKIQLINILKGDYKVVTILVSKKSNYKKLINNKMIKNLIIKVVNCQMKMKIIKKIIPN